MISTCIDSFGNCRGESAVPQIHFKHLQSGQEVKFPPFLEDFSDEYVSSWNEEAVYGRMDPIAVYQRTSRVIAITWKVISANEVEAVDNMEKIKTLVSFHYPSYFGKKNAGKMQTAPILRFKFPPFVQNAATGGGLMGYTKGVTFKPNIDAGFIFVGKTMLPKEVTLNCQFTVLHTHQLGFNANSNKRFNSKFPYSLPKKPQGCGGPDGDGSLEASPTSAPKPRELSTKASGPAAKVTAGAAAQHAANMGHLYGQTLDSGAWRGEAAVARVSGELWPARVDAAGTTDDDGSVWDAALGGYIRKLDKSQLPFTDEELTRQVRDLDQTGEDFDQ